MSDVALISFSPSAFYPALKWYNATVRMEIMKLASQNGVKLKAGRKISVEDFLIKLVE